MEGIWGDSPPVAMALETCLERVVVLMIGSVAFVLKDIGLLGTERCTTAAGVNGESAGPLVDVDWLLACPLICTPLEATTAIVHKLQR